MSRPPVTQPDVDENICIRSTGNGRVYRRVHVEPLLCSKYVVCVNPAAQPSVGEVKNVS
jgi:hypothetical protein